MSRKKPFIMTSLKTSRLDPNIVHCLLDQPYPFGKHKALWEITFKTSPHRGLDIRYMDSPDVRIILATIQVNPKGGEEIISEFAFYGRNAAQIYNPPPKLPKMLQFEHSGRILYAIAVKDSNLDMGFREIFPLLQLSQHTTAEETRLEKDLYKYGHKTRRK